MNVLSNENKRLGLIPKGSSVSKGYNVFHFECIYLSVHMVKIHKIFTALSHLSLEQDPMVAFSKS